MEWDKEWTKAQQLLTIASKNEHWWLSLPQDKIKVLGRSSYKNECGEARQKVKAADLRCKSLIELRRYIKNQRALNQG